MKLTEFLPLQLVRVPLVARDKTQAITELVDLLAEHGRTAARDQLLDAILERESQLTTGIGRGFAIPHAKCDAVERLAIAFGRAAEPIDFEAIDGKPVSLIALLASPTNATSLHVEALATLSRMVKNEAALDALLSAQTADAFYKVIVDNEGAS
ncbi:MAG: PTS sugar transporter subunit IIA [Planctomycetota bacterium]|nr:PTS sugar transporter subunit IIA [Planctomycetota bacterium]MCZ6699626.1 PTS sugar transporter subunit IIA [Planctomycetota bacterium]MCZ6817389.1 PTS sugar transporter subunit IIA [Planctomycetota bacterium]